MEGDRICRDYRLEADATLRRGHADLLEERFRFWAQLSGKQCSIGFQPVSGVRCRIEQHWVTVPQKIWRPSRKNFPSCLLPMRAPWTPADEPLINSATRELLTPDPLPNKSPMARERPINEHSPSHNVLPGDESPVAAVIAVCTVVAQREIAPLWNRYGQVGIT